MDGFLLWRADDPENFTRLDRSTFHIEGFARGVHAVLDPPGNRLYHLTRRGEELHCRDLRGDRTRRPAWTIDVTEATLLAINLDGSRLAVAERSGQIVLVDTSRGAILDRLTPPNDDPAPVDSLAFSPDGRTLAVGSREQIRLWTLGTKPRAAVRLPGHRGSVRSLAFDTKGVRLAGADEKTIKVWDLGSLHAELARLGLDW
jgi:WD40 repeat protein